MKRLICLFMCACVIVTSLCGCSIASRGKMQLEKNELPTYLSHKITTNPWETTQEETTEATEETETEDYQATTEEVIPQDGANKGHFYEKLNSRQKEAYDELWRSANNFEEKAELPELTEEELAELYQGFCDDNPMLFFLDVNYSWQTYNSNTVFHLKYICSADEYAKRLAEAEAALSEAMNLINSGMSDFDKELVLHDWLVDKCVYLEGTNAHSPYGALVEGKAVCEGYAEAMKLLLDRAGIDNYLLIGDTLPETDDLHEWNIVEIGGDNYHLDVTWDDSDSQDVIEHAYFNLSDEEISADHYKFISEANPGCTSTEANYFRIKGGYLEDYEEVADYIRRAASAAPTNNEIILEYRVATNSAYNQIVKKLFDNKGINEVLNSVDCDWDSYKYYKVDGMQSILLKISVK